MINLSKKNYGAASRQVQRSRTRVLQIVVVWSAAVASFSSAVAQQQFGPADATQAQPDHSVPTLAPVVVEGLTTPQSRAAERIGVARESMARTAGGTAVVSATSYRDGRAATLSDALAFAPGVLAQSRHGEETRFSIRGSGIQRGFLLRGIQLYQDGIALNHADGAGDFQAVEPLAAQYIEIWRGANALEHGANGLGGAVNFVSPTGLTAVPLTLRTQAGSFGQRLNQVALAGMHQALDGYLSVTHSKQDGYRDQSGTEATRFFGNVGARLSDSLEARVFLTYLDTKLDMPGSLTRAAYDINPRQAAPNYESLDAHNDYVLHRGAIRLNWTPNATTEVTTSAYLSDRKRDHAMTFAVLNQDLRDTGLDSRLVHEFGSDRLTRRLTLGAAFANMSGTEARYANVGGNPGARTGRTHLSAKQYVVYGQYDHGFSENWVLQLGVQALRAERNLQNYVLPTNGYEESYSGLSPKLGLIYKPDNTSQLFANVSRSFEAPPFGELVVRPAFPLASAQRATTYEAGYRKRVDELQLDVALYQSNVKGELLSLNDSRGAALGTVNAEKTVHRGIELGAALPLHSDVLWRTNYLFNDFRFDHDPVYGNNRLAGIPKHVVRTEIKWTIAPWLYVTPGIEWMPGKTYVDHANTVSASGYTLLNLKLGGAINRQTSWFVEGRNLADRKYISSTAVQADARGRDGAYYFPGDGRAVYAGLQWQL